MISISELFTELLTLLHDKNKRAILEELFCEALDISWSDFKLHPQRPLENSDIEKIKTWFQLWNSGQPLAYIVGRKSFYGHEFLVNTNVLIPRSETEILVEKALELLDQTPHKVMDLGTGSGCIGLSIAQARPNSEVLLIDASQDALAVAEKNKERLQLKNVETLALEITAEAEAPKAWETAADVIVANPPYIESDDPRVEKSVHQFEPHLALYSDQKGFGCLKTWLFWTHGCLKNGGHYIFEFGEGQETPPDRLYCSDRLQYY